MNNPRVVEMPLNKSTKLNLDFAGIVEYTGCISADGYDPPPMSVLVMTLNNLMMRIN